MSEYIAKFTYVGPWEEPKLTKLAHIEPDTLPDAGDYNALVDVVNAMAEIVEMLAQRVEVLSNWRDTEIYIGRHGLK